MTPDERKIVQNRLVGLSRRISPANVTKFMEGKYQLVPTALKLNGNNRWAYSLTIGQKDCTGTSATQPQAVQPKAFANETFYKCPEAECKGLMYADHRNCVFSNIAKGAKCQHCTKCTPAGRWRCLCNKPWFLCKEHARQQVLNVAIKRRMAMPRMRATKMARKMEQSGVQTHEQLLASDLSRASREAKRMAEPNILSSSDDPASVVKRIKFGPKIAQRFGLQAHSIALAR